MTEDSISDKNVQEVARQFQQETNGELQDNLNLHDIETQLHQFDDISTDHQELDLGCVDGSGPDNSLQISTGDLLDTFELVDVKQSLSDSEVKQEKKRSLAEASSSDAEAIKTNNSNEEFSESGGNQEDGDGNSSRGGKKPRLVWTAELHSRFMNAVNHLGVKHAVPKAILQLMNVEGMTRENVASHLQKYRLYLKRLAGLPPSARLPHDLVPTNTQPYFAVQSPMDVVSGMVMPAQPVAMATPVHQAYPAHSYPPIMTAPGQPQSTAVGMPLGGRVDPYGTMDHSGGIPVGTAYPMGVPHRPPPMAYPSQLYGYPHSTVPAAMAQPWDGRVAPGQSVYSDMSSYGMPSGTIMGSPVATGAPATGAPAVQSTHNAVQGVPLNTGNPVNLPGNSSMSLSWQGPESGPVPEPSINSWVEEKDKFDRWTDSATDGGAHDW